MSLLALEMPRIGAMMSAASLVRVFVRVGARVPAGTRLVDVLVDLSAVAEQNCLPISEFAIVTREDVWVRSLASRGEVCRVGARIGLFATHSGDDADGPSARPLRMSIVGLSSEPGMPWPTVGSE